MNFIKQINQFYKILPNNSLSANAQCLYMYLLNKNNEVGWLDEFTVPNLIVCGYTSLSRQAMDRARNELIQKGYIKYKKGISNQAGKYLIVSFITQDDTQNDTQGDTQDDTQGGHTASTLNKQNKTKQDIKENKEKKFVAPTFEEIKNYIFEKGLSVDAQKFYNYFSEGNWIDSKGNKVKNWKQKILTWNSYSNQNQNKTIDLPKYHEKETGQYSNLSGFYANI